MANNKRNTESEQTSPLCAEGRGEACAGPDRRAFGKAVLAGVLGGPAALSSVTASAKERTASSAGKRLGRPGVPDQGMKLALMLRPEEQERRILASQIGVKHAIVSLATVLDKITRDQYLDTLTKIKATYEEVGLSIAAVESHPVSAEKIKLGLPGRDEEIANYTAVIEALGKLGIPMCCYNFMAGIGWFRTKVDVPERGGALVSEFDKQDAEKLGPTQWGQVSEEKIWDNLAYFLKRIIPVAEKAGVKMALHPDDPPISPLRGIGRILTSAEAFRKVMRLVPSQNSGIAFCQGNFMLMGGDIKETIKKFAGQGKIFFVHFRDVLGTREHFRETFHDNGPSDMVGLLKLYHEVGFRGPIRPDHAPTLAGESNERPGYAMQGRILAVGYMKGIAKALNIPLA